METTMDRIIKRLAWRWCLKWPFLKDVYFLMLNDIRFSSGKSVNGIRYAKMSKHLLQNYGIELHPYQLKYMVYLIKTENRGK